MRVRTARSTFLALAESIVYQQLNGRAAATIFARLCALFPNPHTGFTPEQLLRVSVRRLRGAGLSRTKLLSLRDLAERARSGEIPDLTALHDLDDEAIIEQLSQVRGIGRWTVQMLLMFHFGRPDVMPVDDYGVRNGFRLAYGLKGLPKPKALLAYAERWKPYRSAAAWYLWRAVEMHQQGRLPKRAGRAPRIELEKPKIAARPKRPVRRKARAPRR
jgi:3-methyladenine DNA glycosylase/8-oxoguanine DNA glycosylase